MFSDTWKKFSFHLIAFFFLGIFFLKFSCSKGKKCYKKKILAERKKGFRNFIEVRKKKCCKKKCFVSVSRHFLVIRYHFCES